MYDFSILIGGKAGFGIENASSLIGSIFNHMGYQVYIYRDYPSLIRGGHTFSIIRASKKKVRAHGKKADFILALNQETVDLHKDQLIKGGVLIFDADVAKAEGIGLFLSKIIQEEKGLDIMRNACIVAAFCKSAGIEWKVLEEAFKLNISKEIDLNLKVASRVYKETEERIKIERVSSDKNPLLQGNEVIGLGLVQAGLSAYVAYPMTPASTILHFLASEAETFGLKVLHPESEISVIITALGMAYAGIRVAVGTSGGGFCLMTEGLSFAGMAELPIVIVVAQRGGPSTGLPTYTGQADLQFVLTAGHGEFLRLVVAPGDIEEAFYWAGASLNLAWKCQIPAIVLSDKNLSENVYSFDRSVIKKVQEEKPLLWDRKATYLRYKKTDSGVSPLAFPGERAVIKINSYEHDEMGITTEAPEISDEQQEKRLRKEKILVKELEKHPCVNVYGKGSTALLCWGSNKGVCLEVAERLGCKVIQPVVLHPFPKEFFAGAFTGVKKVIAVEHNIEGQLARLCQNNGFKVDATITRYDGRPFTLEELEEKVRAIL